MKRENRRRLLFLLIVSLVMLMMQNPNKVNAASIQVDGRFIDWESFDGDKIKVAYDAENLYVYAESTWQYYYSKLFSYKINGSSLNAPMNSFIVQLDNNSASGSFQPVDSWWRKYSNSEGYYINSGSEYQRYETTEIEFCIPLTTLGITPSTIETIEVEGISAVSLITQEVNPTPVKSVAEMNEQYDWSEATTVPVSGTENIQQVQMFCDGESVYIKVVESGYLGSFTQGQAKLGLNTNMGLIYKLDVSSMDYTTYDITFLNYERITGKGYKNDQGLLTYEIRVPLTELWDTPNNISEVMLIWAQNEETILTVDNPWYQPSSQEQPVIAPTSELIIDGYFSDWDLLPAQEITYQSWNNAGNHNGSIYSDGEKIYCRFEMNRLYGRQMMVQVIYLKVDQQVIQLTIQGSNQQQIRYDNIIYDFPLGITGGIGDTNTALGIFTDGEQKVYLGPAAFHRYSDDHNPGDACEFAIDLDTLAEYLGVKKEGLATSQFSINNPNIGTQWLTVVGSPTFAAIGLTIVIPFALFGAYKTIRRRKVSH